MKHGNKFYLELTREIFTEKYKDLSVGAKWLFVVLNELEQRYTGKKNDFFLRTDEQLVEDTGFSINTVRKYKIELKKTGLVHIGKGRYVDPQTGKKSERQFTAYRSLK